jgi:hypothetical protein
VRRPKYVDIINKATGALYEARILDSWLRLSDLKC